MARRSYTSRPAPAPEPFDLDGVTFTPAGTLSLLDISKMALLADVESTDPSAIAAMHEVFKGALGGVEYTRFADHVRKHRTDPDTLLAIFQDMAEQVSENPTERSSPSSDGPTTTGPTHTVISSSGEVIQMPLTPERAAELRAAVERAELEPRASAG